MPVSLLHLLTLFIHYISVLMRENISLIIDVGVNDNNLTNFFQRYTCLETDSI